MRDNRSRMERGFKKYAPPIGIAVFGLVMGWSFISGINGVLRDGAKELEKERAKYERYIGKEIEIDGKKSTITDFNMVNGSFTLGNGATVNKILVTKQLGDN